LIVWRPNVESYKNYVEILNESVGLIVSFLLYVFTDSVDSIETKYKAGTLRIF
jgi:hypothetical protein